MHDLFFSLQKELEPVLRAGDIIQCEKSVSEALAVVPDSPFHSILHLSITNNPVEVASYFDDFFRREALRFEIAAAYTETNGFDINPGRWFFAPFAYVRYGGRDNYDWISDWQSDDYRDMTLTGLEPLQNVYASDAFGNEKFNEACTVTCLLVVIKFQDLIRRAAAHMKELRFPLLATGHDFDFIYEVRKGSK